MTDIVFFDGNCPFCNKTVMQLAKLDERNQFMFVSNISNKGKEMLKKKKLLMASNSTIVTLTNGVYYTKIKAIYHFLRTAKKLLLLQFFIWIIPLFLSNRVYDYIARNRLKIVKGACEIPSQQLLEKFVLE